MVSLGQGAIQRGLEIKRSQPFLPGWCGSEAAWVMDLHAPSASPLRTLTLRSRVNPAAPGTWFLPLVESLCSMSKT